MQSQAHNTLREKGHRKDSEKLLGPLAPAQKVKILSAGAAQHVTELELACIRNKLLAILIKGSLTLGSCSKCAEPLPQVKQFLLDVRPQRTMERLFLLVMTLSVGLVYEYILENALEFHVSMLLSESQTFLLLQTMSLHP